MKIIETVSELNAEILELKAQNKSIGLVPTMGALHEGHASLVEKSVKENDVTIVSVFVNPTQFNDKNDLNKYPRTLKADCELLKNFNADYVFTPSVEEVYPEEDKRVFNYPPLDQVMEGRFRPGHFNGVCQVVSKLFLFTQPDRAYFGEKDFQQLAIIRKMVKEENFNIEIVGCPIIREKDGLAMSSRNKRLSEEEHKKALNISRILFESCNFAKNNSIADTVKWVSDSIENQEGLTLEYFQIVDGDTLQQIDNWEDANYIIGCITVFCGEVRLIDNIAYKTK